MRKSLASAVPALVALALFGAVYAGSNEKPPAGRQPDCCKQLLSRIEALEARIQALEARGPSAVLPERYPAPLRIDPKRLPPGAQEREFNGMKYYIIPLDEGRTNSAPAATAPPPPRR